KNFPYFVNLASSLVTCFESASLFTFKVLNLKHLNSWLSLPDRDCTKNTGPLEFSFIKIASKGTSQDNRKIIMNRLNKISNNRFLELATISSSGSDRNDNMGILS